MRMRVVLITEIIAPYRIPVFNALACHTDIDLHVIFLSETDFALRLWPIYKEEIRFSYEVLPNWRRSVGCLGVLLNWGVTAALDRISPQLVVCGGYNYVASWGAMFWCQQQKIPMLAWVESTLSDNRRQLWPVEALKAKFLRGCAGAIVAGKSSFAYVKSFGVAEEKIKIAPNAVDNDFFSCLAAEARESRLEVRIRLRLPRRYFLFAGRLVREKGVFELLEAYAALADEIRREVGLVFAGDGVARSELEHKALQISGGEIRLVGFAQRELLTELYALAEALVFPTHSDPWGLVVNEAMACGLPIIATKVAGCVPDLVEDGWNGRVIATQSPAELAVAMTELAHHPDLGLLGRRSAERIRLHSPERCAAGFAEAIRFRLCGFEKQSAGASA